MKKGKEIFRLKYFNLCLIVVSLFSSCETYHFAYPLPVDSKNIYKTPRKLRGFIPEEKGSQKGYLLKKHSIETGDNDTLKIIDGIWINPRDTSHAPKSDTIEWKRLEALKYYDSRYSVKFDSLKNPIDTVENYVIKGDRLYAIEDGGLTKGYAFSIVNDTFLLAPKFELLELGPNIFFRKVTSDIYILNIKDGLVGDKNRPWWQIILFVKGKDGKLIFHYWERTIEKNPSLIYSTGSEYYFDSQWTRKDILKLIDDGMFDPMNED